MPVTINGDGSITGLAVGGLPDGCVDADTLAAGAAVPADGSITAAKLASGAITAASCTITGNLGVAGVLTYEDVTNIDAIGIITARAGINVTGGTITGDGSGLTGLPAGAPVGGASTNTVFFENDNSVDVSYTISTDKNAMAAGPIAIKAGVTVTVPSGSFLTIV